MSYLVTGYKGTEKTNWLAYALGMCQIWILYNVLYKNKLNIYKDFRAECTCIPLRLLFYFTPMKTDYLFAYSVRIKFVGYKLKVSLIKMLTIAGLQTIFSVKYYAAC